MSINPKTGHLNLNQKYKEETVNKRKKNDNDEWVIQD